MANITSAEFQRKLGLYQDKALSQPVTITKNGRERLVLLSVEEYRRLKSLDRRAFRTADLPDEWIDAVQAAKVPGEYAHLDDELKDWNP